MTSSSHSGVSTDDRAYLVQQVAVLTGLAAPDSERRVDAAIADFLRSVQLVVQSRTGGVEIGHFRVRYGISWASRVRD